MEHAEWIRPYLMPDEFILWEGRPEKGGVFTRQDIFLIPFSIVWCGFAIFWEISVLQTVQTGVTSVFFLLWGIPFVLVGLYLVFGRFFVMKYTLAHTFYAITNYRVLISQNGKMNILDRRVLPFPQLSVKPDGTGTIHFGDSIGGYSASYRQRNRVPEFRNIAQASRVFNILMGS